MKKREIIIIVVAAVFVIYGLLDFFVFSGKAKNGVDNKIAGQIEKINAFADSAGSELTAVIGKKEFPDIGYLISKAESEWEHDPFMVYSADQLRENGSTQETVKLMYTGFIQAGKKILAVINGMEYEIGELLKDAGYKVHSISPSRVVLLTELNKEIILQLEDN